MKRGRLFAFGLVLAAVATATAARLWLDDWLGARSPFGTYYIAVLAVAWFAGLPAALAAIVASAFVAEMLFILPRWQVEVDPETLVSTALFAVVGVSMAAVISALREAERRATASAAEAESNRAGLEREVIERREKERRLRLSEERYRLLSELAPLAIWILSPAGDIEYVNRYCEDYLGRPWMEGADPHRRGVVHRDDLPRVREAFTSALRSELGFSLDFRIRRASDGAYRWHAVQVQPLRDAAGGVMRWLGVAADVEERRQAEDAARASERRLRSLAEAVPGFLFAFRPDGPCTYANQAFYGFTGAGAHTAEGFGWTALLDPEDASRFAREWGEAVRQERGFPVELRFRRRDGVYRWFKGHTAPVWDDRGTIAQWLGVLVDVEDQKTAQQALLDADRRKDEFLAMLGHELRSPLAPIRNSVEILRRVGRLEGEAGVARDRMERQVRHLVRLVDDLLDVSRVSSGKINLRRSRVAVSEVLTRAIEIVRDEIRERGFVFSVSLPPGEIAVDGDPDRLTQVFANLLSNAVKFTPAGASITVDWEVEGPAIVVRVRDAGCGIGAEELPRIFDVFAQAEDTIDRSRGGLGLGLSLVRSILRLHGGSVEAHSDGPGKGAEFVVRLPMAAQEAFRSAAPRSTPAPGSPLRVLVVDDSRDAAESFGTLLRILGHEVRVVSDGHAAVAAAIEMHPDIAFVDIGLPGMDGLEVARRLRAMPDLARTRLVALSGYGQDEDRRRALSAGFDEHVVKPIDIGALEEMLGAAGAQGRPADGEAQRALRAADPRAPH